MQTLSRFEGGELEWKSSARVGLSKVRFEIV